MRRTATRSAAILILLVLALVPLAALDWGGTLDNATTYTIFISYCVRYAPLSLKVVNRLG